MRYTERDGQGRQGGREDVDEYEEKCVHRAAGAGHAAVGAAKAECAVCAGTEYDQLLAASMLLVGSIMFQLKEKKKVGGTLIFAFGLFCIVAAVVEIRNFVA